MSKNWITIVLLLILNLLSCNKKEEGFEVDIATELPASTCGTYPDWETSNYILPFPVGETFRVSQANCTVHSHKSTLRYAYDLQMPFGSVVTAARDGIVHAIRIDQAEGSTGLTASNWIQIRHTDNMKSEYVHLEQYSSFVNVGDAVQKGDTIALTGNTGDVGTYPHLHFDISPCGNNLTCGTEPITFSNTDPNPVGLEGFKFYEAFAY